MTARVITITSGKGGVGKTTTTANIGVALASLGHKVVCVDADIGLRNLDVVMGLENRIVYDLVDIVEGRARLRQAMIKDKRLKDELYLIPAAQTRDKTAVSPSDMVHLCDELKPLVDYILIDSPAGIERGFRNAVAPADEVLIVTNPEVSSVRDADRIIGLIEAEGKGPGRLVINRVKPDMVKRGDMLSPDDIIDILAIDLIGLVPEDEGILISTNRGAPAALEPENNRAGQAFLNIARRLAGEDVPFMPLEDNSTWLQRLMRRLGLASDDANSPAVSQSRPASTPSTSLDLGDIESEDEDEDSSPAESKSKATTAKQKKETAPASEVEPVEAAATKKKSKAAEGVDAEADASKEAPRTRKKRTS